MSFGEILWTSIMLSSLTLKFLGPPYGGQKITASELWLHGNPKEALSSIIGNIFPLQSRS